jgi:large subunit ribosomal protein L4
MKVDILDTKYEPSGLLELSDELFGLEIRADILSRVVRWQLAKRRAGTHSTKTIGFVRGSGKKIVKQKGSGGARHGSKRAVQFRGGGIIFGPNPHSHEFSLQKKVRKLGLRMALADKMKSGELMVLQNFDFDVKKTKDFAKLCGAHCGKSALFVDGEISDSLSLVVNNCPAYDVIPQIGLNVYDILKCERLIVTVDAIDKLQARLS